MKPGKNDKKANLLFTLDELDLPAEYLKEIANFVVFVRLRAFQPHIFQQDDFTEVLRRELAFLSKSEETHLEAEFADYQKLYPVE